MVWKMSLKCVDLSINILISITSIFLCISVDYKWIILLLIPIINHLFIAHANIANEQPIHHHFHSSNSSSGTVSSSEYGDVASVDEASLLSMYLKQRRNKKKQQNMHLFEYADISLSDDTDKVISLLRRLSDDIDDALDSISNSPNCCDEQVITSMSIYQTFFHFL